MLKIAVVAPSGAAKPGTKARFAEALAASPHAGKVEIAIHRDAFAADHHFAGSDEVRLAAFLEAANDPTVDVVWALRGGYGSSRLLAGICAGLGPAARDKVYIGYSDFGFVLAALQGQGVRRLAHGPMPVDAGGAGGAAAVDRVLGFLTSGFASGLDPAVKPGSTRRLAFNVTVLRSMLATPWMPQLAGAELFLEDVGEHDYALDRTMCQLAATEAFRTLAGVRIGRFSYTDPVEQKTFGIDQAEIVRFWCGRAGVPVLGAADIGHDSGNRIVPFGAWAGPDAGGWA